MSFDTDIAIVGGGLSGPTLALALANAGLSVTVIDAQKAQTRMAPDFDGRSYALALTSVRLLEGIGLWDAVADNAQPMLEIKVTDGRAGEGPSPFFMHFDHAEIEEGPMGHMVQDRHLRQALMDAVTTAENITVMNENRGCRAIGRWYGNHIDARERQSPSCAVVCRCRRPYIGNRCACRDQAYRLGLWSNCAGLCC